MKWEKPPKLYTIGWLVSMPFITLALCYIMYGPEMWRNWRIPAACYIIIYAIGFVSWRLHVVYDLNMRKKFPSLDQTAKRVRYKTAINLVIMTPSVLLIFFLFHTLRIFNYQIQENDLLYGYLVGLAINIIFETLWEVNYLVEKHKETAMEKELLERMQLMQEFTNLKQKVNPHFLFNCFNTLLALIAEDKTKAEAFLDELSKVYRYLLRNNQSGMSTLADEVNFIKSYSRLLQTRYGQGFQLQMNIDPAVANYELPALSLQLLVENAVKHNIISKQNPVLINISATSSGRLIVENNLARKINKPDSTGIGLANIREKYRLLKRDDVVAEERSEKFFVSLPLLEVGN